MRLLALAVLFLGSIVFAADDVTDAGKTAEAFYNLYLNAKVSSGVPTRSQIALLRTVVSKELFSLLESANKAERYYKKKNRGRVPPLVEGDLFTSLFEGAVSYELKPCETKDGSAQCMVPSSMSIPETSQSYHGMTDSSW